MFARPSKLFSWLQHHHLALLLVLVGIKQLLAVSAFPAWIPADEPAHFQYTQTIVEERRFPVFDIQKKLYSQEVIDSFRFTEYQIKNKFQIDRPKADLEHGAGAEYRQSAPTNGTARNYAAPYGPVYYLFEAIPYALAYSQPILIRLFWMRVFSSIWVLLTVWFGYRIVQRLRPGSGPALTVAIMVGFWPMISNGGLNVDAFLIFLATAAFDRYTAWLHKTPERKQLIIAGLITGLAAMTKQTGWIVLLMGLTTLLIVFRGQSWRSIFRSLSYFLVPAFMLGISWIVRGHFVDITNFYSGEHALPSSSQANFFSPLWIFVFDVSVRLSQVWITAVGYFGFGLPLFPHFIYGAIAILAGTTLVRCIMYLRSRSAGSLWKTWLIISLIGWVMLEGLFQLLFWHRAIHFHILSFPNQGRYYFILIVPIMSVLMTGLEEFVGKKHRAWAWGILAGLIVSLNIWSLWIVFTHYGFLRL